MESIDYEIIVDTDKTEQLELLHENVKKYGTVFNKVAPGTVLSGVLRREIYQLDLSQSHIATERYRTLAGLLRSIRKVNSCFLHRQS